MIAIGGTIGTGLFLGAGTAIAEAGPSLLIWYALAGAVVFLVVRALGELLMYRPASGSFADYAREFLGPFWGYATTWTYWIMWVTTGMAEITAAGQFVRYWYPGFDQWKTALIALVVLTCANLISVKIFGELEFWFAMVKVTAILGVILVGLGVLVLGFGDAGRTASVTHLWADGGLAPHGVWNSLMTLQIVLFAYLGVELVGVTAGETKDPEKNIPRAINTLPLRFGLFYIGALVVILSVVSWSEFHPGTSPFVAAFTKIGIPAAAGIVNFVVLTSALSSCNAGGLYATARMLRTAGLNGDGPTSLARLTDKGVPRTALFVSALVMAGGVAINAIDPEHAFTYITSVSTGGAILVWSIILVTHLRYREAVREGRAAASPYRMPGAPYSNWLALAGFAFVTVLIAWHADTRVSLYVIGVWIILLVAGYAARRTRTPATTAATAEDV
ncbi:proline-specific permease ProY [Streptomyces monashensis]|uniref:Proline-specific permease ProY n=2 Tax=Streptomyces monashensis TaxID=1678012 RepID=A0A1S2QQR8_9ACTN|nr:proline-specific permease ProY [Streptomyces monashensis]